MTKEMSPRWVVLGLLTQKPMHGYELHHFFTSPSPLEQVWYLGISQMYKLLKELEKQGHVEVSIEPQESRPDKKVYHVTPSGRQAFLEWLQTPVSGIRLIRIEFLGKLFLAQSLGAEMVERVIDIQTEACHALLAELDERRPAGGFEDLVLRFRTGQVEAAIDWLRYCRSALPTSG
ncbi:MAG: PadR family transcriptional regulator [Anaerolineae bacterium]